MLEHASSDAIISTALDDGISVISNISSVSSGGSGDPERKVIIFPDFILWNDIRPGVCLICIAKDPSEEELLSWLVVISGSDFTMVDKKK